MTPEMARHADLTISGVKHAGLREHLPGKAPQT